MRIRGADTAANLAHRTTGRRRPPTFRACLLAALLSLAGGRLAAAGTADRDPAWFPYHHTAWALADGAPAGISGLAQTADGYLWLGAATGLFRFDGVRFERFEAPAGQALRSRNISALAALPSGALWVGHRFGGASRMEAGRIDNYGAEQGLPAGTLLAFTEDGKGRTWAGSSHGVAQFDGRAWRRVGLGDPAESPDDQAVYTLMADRQGALWASADRGVYVLRPGETRFARVSEAGGFAWMVQAPDGQVWASQGAPGLRPWSLDSLGRAQTAASAFSLGGETGAFAFDRRGSLWVGTPAGVMRLPSADWQQRGRSGPAASLPPAFSRQQGLSGELVLAALEDHEGTLWLGTNGGLDRFRRNKLNRVALPPEALWFALAPDTDGSVWAGSVNRALFHLEPGETVAVKRLPEMGGRITTAFRDRAGQVWMGGAEGLWRGNRGHFEPVAVPPALAGSPLQAMAQDGAGDLLLAVPRKGVYRLPARLAAGRTEAVAAAAWQLEPGLDGASDRYPLAMATDGRGRRWSAYPDNVITAEQAGRQRRYGPSDGLQVGNALALLATGDRLWVAGELGLAWFDGQGFRTLQAAEPEDLQGLSGVVEAADGALWTNGAAGVVRISPQDLQAALADPNRSVRTERFDFRDGLEGAAVQLRPVPSAVAGSDGKLWFATNNGVVWIDPLHVPRNPLPPPVAIQSLLAEGQPAPLPAAAGQGAEQLALPVGTRSLAIRYTALSLAIPERVRFRYQLEGVDSGWQEAGARREAFYTNLGPGAYRFTVRAANDDGVWNDAGARLTFTVLPAFWQTWWFRLLCVPLVGGLLWVLYQLRLRVMAERLSDRLQARMIERERIARELHDTLLQSVQGLILRFQSGAARLAPDDPVRDVLGRALDRAEQVLEEGRDRVNDLRLQPPGGRDLAQGLERLAVELTDQVAERVDAEPPTFQMRQQGQARPLRPGVDEELYRIVREALVNAFTHAGAARIALQLDWGEDALGLSVSDDGCGIAPAVLAAGGRAGHWGLAGMQERAGELRAELSLRSEPGSGTSVSLRLPAALAYAQAAPKHAWWRRAAPTGRPAPDRSGGAAP